MMSDNITDALKSLNPADCDYTEWIKVGMALKEEGYDVGVWDEWSRDDYRYHPGECQHKWNNFNGGSGTPVTGGTIIQIAKDHGWEPLPAWGNSDGCMAWDDEIEYDGISAPAEWDPVQDLITYLETIFEPNDHVCYVTGEVWQNDDGRWLPGRGVSDRTAEELIKTLKKHPNDIGATIGDWKPEAGAWIRMNPVDGRGVSDENVTAFRYALVESDSIPIEEQDELYRKLNLPIAALVHSGGKSLHAIVHIDAADLKEYRERVDFLYSTLEKNGLKIDKQDRNPSRLSRIPGVTRNGNRQYLIGTNIGKKSWTEWIADIDDAPATLQNLPKIISLKYYVEHPPVLAEELIEGILRRGHKMLISGSSKAGKSFLLMELCVAIATGGEWLGFKCRKGRILYVNLEIDKDSAADRFLKIYDALGLDPAESSDSIEILNLRGRAVTLDKLAPQLIEAVKGHDLDAIIIDPIYKVITGDENNASDMGAFCNNFDKICNETGCSVIYCHHHSKGAQGGKNAMDRASGSGVFARDPDAQLDMIELVMDEDIKNNVRDGNETAWRLESSLREFPNIQPVNFWYDYPIHRVDTSGGLEKLGGAGSQEAKSVNLEASGKRKGSPDSKRQEMINAFDNLSAFAGTDYVKAKDLYQYLGISKETFYKRMRKIYSDIFQCEDGIVTKID